MRLRILFLQQNTQLSDEHSLGIFKLEKTKRY